MSLFNWNKRKIKTTVTSDTPARQLYDALIRDDIAPFLKSLHYSRKGNTFVKKRDDEVYTVINFQGGKWNDMEYEQEFYVNAAIISPSVYRAFYGEETTLKEYEGVISFRVEEFVKTLPASIKIRKGTDTAPIKDRLLEGIKQIEQDVFAQFNSLDDIRRYLEKKMIIKGIQPLIGLPPQAPVNLAIIYGLQGDMAQAEVAFRSHIAAQMKRKDISQHAKRSIIRTCLLQAQSIGCTLHYPELNTESLIRITFAISRRIPAGDENKSIRRFENLLSKLTYEKRLGYTKSYSSRAKPGELTFRFYTENPDEVMMILEKLAAKVPIKPVIYIEQGAA